MLLIFTLARMDVLPADDVGVREGYRRLKRLERQPSRGQMLEFGRSLVPYRLLAAWYLWWVMDT